MSKFQQQNIRAGKLTPSAVIELRRLYHEERWTQGALARKYQISVGQVGRIVRGESWQQYTMPCSDEQIEHTAATAVPTSEAEVQESVSILEKILAARPDSGAGSEPDPLSEILRSRGGEDPLGALAARSNHPEGCSCVFCTADMDKPLMPDTSPSAEADRRDQSSGEGDKDV